MRLTRLFVDAELTPGLALELPPETAAHVAKVLRARSGEALILFNGDGREFAAEIEALRGSRVVVAVGPGTPVNRESPLALTLLQCIPRGDRMDFIVQKATELGVTHIVPVLSQRSVVRISAGQAASKAVHWRAVAVSACEQCGRNRLPLIDAPRQLLDHLGAAASGGMRLLLDPEAAPQDRSLPPAGPVQVAVGPEGGFSPEEMDAFRLSGFFRIRLGPRILRAETAAIAAVTWLQSSRGDLCGK